MKIQDVQLFFPVTSLFVVERVACITNNGRMKNFSSAPKLQTWNMARNVKLPRCFNQVTDSIESFIWLSFKNHPLMTSDQLKHPKMTWYSTGIKDSSRLRWGFSPVSPPTALPPPCEVPNLGNFETLSKICTTRNSAEKWEIILNLHPCPSWIFFWRLLHQSLCVWPTSKGLCFPTQEPWACNV